VVSIEDPGHGMTPGEIGALYARMAREGDSAKRDGAGIGCEIIARLCDHLGWGLRIEALEPRGTRAILDFGVALVEA
jgi:K+-sensing histidine kinase KdpD